jgi:epoxyqueuosine reductase QueG
MTRAAQRDRMLDQRLRELGFEELAGYLRHAYSTGASLRSIAKAAGVGWTRLRRELDAAGIAR